MFGARIGRIVKTYDYFLYVVCPCTLVGRKRKRLLNTVDVVERLLVPTDRVPNIRHLRVLKMFSVMTSLKLLIQQRVEKVDEFRQHDSVVTVMVM